MTGTRSSKATPARCTAGRSSRVVSDLMLAPPLGAEHTDTASLRRVLGHFCTGVVVVTAVDEGERVGLTCHSFSSFSLPPPLVLFSASHSSTSWPRIRATGAFAVNILAA